MLNVNTKLEKSTFSLFAGLANSYDIFDFRRNCAFFLIGKWKSTENKL